MNSATDVMCRVLSLDLLVGLFQVRNSHVLWTMILFNHVAMQDSFISTDVHFCVLFWSKALCVQIRVRIPCTCSSFGFIFRTPDAVSDSDSIPCTCMRFCFELCTPPAAFGTIHALAVLGFCCRKVLWKYVIDRSTKQ